MGPQLRSTTIEGAADGSWFIQSMPGCWATCCGGAPWASCTVRGPPAWMPTLSACSWLVRVYWSLLPLSPPLTNQGSASRPALAWRWLALARVRASPAWMAMCPALAWVAMDRQNPWHPRPQNLSAHVL